MSEIYRFVCCMEDEPAGVERLCQVVRRRGFRIDRLEAERLHGHLCVDIHVAGTRAPDTLKRQIEKIVTVRSVRQPLAECFVAE